MRFLSWRFLFKFFTITKQRGLPRNMIYSLSMHQLPLGAKEEGRRCTREPETRPAPLGPPDRQGSGRTCLCSLRGQRVANRGAGASPRDLPTPQVAISQLPFPGKLIPNAGIWAQVHELGLPSSPWRIQEHTPILRCPSRSPRLAQHLTRPAPHAAPGIEAWGVPHCLPCNLGLHACLAGPGAREQGEEGWVLSLPNLTPRLCIRPGMGSAPARLAQPPPTVTPPNLLLILS